MKHIPRDERKVTDREFLDALDLRRRGLAGIRRALESDDLEGARQALVEYFRKRQHPRWLFDLRNLKRPPIDTVLSSWDEGTGAHMDPLRRVDNLLENRFYLREDTESQVWDFGPNLRWHNVEMRQLASTPYRLKRGGFFRQLAVAHARSGNSAYLSKFVELVDRWLDDWPLVVGPEFHPDTALLSDSDGHDTMTTAYRWMTWMDCLYIGTAFHSEVPVETVFRLIKSLWFTALQYRHYRTSKYIPANHHLWERGVSPFIFGLMLPEFPEVAKLVDQARPVIKKHVHRSFLSDGGYEERSPAHAILAINMFLLPHRLARLNRTPLLDRGQIARIRKCGEMLALLTMPDGSAPDIGDHRSPEATNARMLGAVATQFHSRKSGEVLRRLRINRKSIEPEDRRLLCAKRSANLPLTVCYRRSGFFVARSAWSRRASAMAFSIPGPGIPNHAHDDALSLQLVVRGVPLIGTPISALYSYLNRNRRAQSQKIRGHFYAMTSHNLVLVDGEPLHSIESLIPRWGPDPTPVIVRLKEVAGSVNVEGSHTGYPGVDVSRRVHFSHRKGWTVLDRITGDVNGTHIARWHFEYGVEVEGIEDQFLAIAGAARIRIRVAHAGKLRFRLYRDRKWLEKNPLRPNDPPPWILDLHFDGHDGEPLETHFEIL